MYTFLSPNLRTYVFVDAANNYQTLRAIGYGHPNWKHLYDLFNDNTTLMRFAYYTALPRDMENHGLKATIDWMHYNDITVVSKLMKEYADGSTKGNMDTEIVVDAMGYIGLMDHFVLFSGDSDFCALINRLKIHGIKTTVVASRRAKNRGICSDQLHRTADHFIELTQDPISNLLQTATKNAS